MNNDEHDTYGIFRDFGSTGLVIFERDGSLLKQMHPSADFMLDDIDHEFVDLLGKLRKLNVRFGFVSDQRGMDASTRGRSEFAALAGLLDQLLHTRGANPDFWMSWGEPSQGNGSIMDRGSLWPKPDAGMILRAMEWYGVGRKTTIFVSNSAAGILAANDAHVPCIQYFGPRADNALPGRHHSLPSSVAGILQLRIRIEQKLGLGHRRTG